MRKNFSFSELKGALRTTGLTKTAAVLDPGEMSPEQALENICSVGDTLDANGLERETEKLTASIQVLMSLVKNAAKDDSFEMTFKCPECGAEIEAEVEVEGEEHEASETPKEEAEEHEGEEEDKKE